MKTLIAYSSVTGNTKKFCETIYNNLKDKYDIHLSTVKEMPSTQEYDLIVIGFWVDKGTANKEAKKAIKTIKNKNIAFLGTLGAAPDGPHGQKVVANAAKIPDESCQYFGTFLARGKVSEKLIGRLKLLPLPSKIKDQMYESSIHSREPNEEEYKNGTTFIEDILENIMKNQ